MFLLKKYRAAVVFGCVAFVSSVASAQSNGQPKRIIQPLAFQQVKVDDGFWSPKLKVWTTKTVYDVFDKLEGKYEPDRPDIIAEKAKLGRTRNAFLNFDLVAQGKKNTGAHDGPPWYDGLVYETIRGAADLLEEHPDAALEKKIDAYIDRIAAAQNADPDGYINTYTTLVRPDKRWGTNGGDDKWQHDIYNSGMLMEAAVHYYRATGKTKLLNVAVKLSNYIYTQIGPAPKSNVIPGHGGPEEALLKLYQLFKEQPSLKNKITAPVKEEEYLAMVKFWINDRGNYGEPDGSHARKSDSSYNQDHMPVVQQKTIEGHAVRATLLATGVTATAMETGDAAYANTAVNYWKNMTGKRMFITGGEGAIADGERFGKDYFLPESAYLETCASIGAGFFSQQMNEMEADGKYMDEFERIIYNNFLSGISLNGEQYFYENPLVGNGNKRWSWHDCPCCPPMILKMAGALPQYIYGYSADDVYVNLFIGSEASLKIKGEDVLIKQTTGYPWKGNVRLEVNPQNGKAFTMKIRIPGWAEGKENPYDLYSSNLNSKPVLKVNGKDLAIEPQNGYVAINRAWKKGDIVELQLPMTPRLVAANDSVQTIKNKLAIASGPIIYAFETVDNPDLKNYTLSPKTDLKVSYKPQLLNGVNVVTGQVNDEAGKQVSITAVPFYTLGNHQPGSPYEVWIKKENNQ
ncbi:glycoside hydrolase family 127 protein [Mucilaginibacter sp. SMC90]|uniref:glycoside hydrolase family 127 protein n=1 Tax=Mucilaginibacter sp. SMC90 TaxID=2929803 RepID=UPI001FB1CE5A|nr:beta-L-arabinofuranosidase domain-containing protein [Mucilaginibacter sp. SMC90]UOE46538.1 glycoside hydrolase family 127 protein [Mucilaginibacter sp. SMC90]